MSVDFNSLDQQSLATDDYAVSSTAPNNGFFREHLPLSYYNHPAMNSVGTHDGPFEILRRLFPDVLDPGASVDDAVVSTLHVLMTITNLCSQQTLIILANACFGLRSNVEMIQQREYRRRFWYLVRIPFIIL